jgi:hypothetical protein
MKHGAVSSTVHGGGKRRGGCSVMPGIYAATSAAIKSGEAGTARVRGD